MIYRKIGLATAKRTIRLWNIIWSEPGQPSDQLAELVCFLQWSGAWYRTGYLTWIITSYNTHMGMCVIYSAPHYSVSETQHLHYTVMNNTLCIKWVRFLFCEHILVVHDAEMFSDHVDNSLGYNWPNMCTDFVLNSIKLVQISYILNKFKLNALNSQLHLQQRFLPELDMNMSGIKSSRTCGVVTQRI